MQTKIGTCPKCGAPIYAPAPWHGILPPPPNYTCSCNGTLNTIITTDGTTTDIPIIHNGTYATNAIVKRWKTATDEVVSDKKEELYDYD